MPDARRRPTALLMLALAATALLAIALLVPSTPAGDDSGDGSAAARDGRAEVILYQTAWCGWCRKTRALLDDLDADYETVDIEKSAEGRREYEAKAGGRGGVPLIDIDGTIIHGYDEAKIRRLVKKLDKA